MATNLERMKKNLTSEKLATLIDGDCTRCPVPQKYCNSKVDSCEGVIKAWAELDEMALEEQALRANVLKSMDEYINQAIGDEMIAERWYMCGIPNECDEDEIMEIAEDVNDFRTIVKLFDKLVNEK